MPATKLKTKKPAVKKTKPKAKKTPAKKKTTVTKKKKVVVKKVIKKKPATKKSPAKAKKKKVVKKSERNEGVKIEVKEIKEGKKSLPVIDLEQLAASVAKPVALMKVEETQIVAVGSRVAFYLGVFFGAIVINVFVVTLLAAFTL